MLHLQQKLKGEQFSWNLVLLGDRPDRSAGHSRRDDAGGDVVQHDAACADDRALPDRHATADHGVGADPDILLNRNRFRSADAARALLRVNRMPRTAQTDAGRNKSTCSDMDGGGVQNGAVVVDDGEPMGMDVEPVIAVKGRLDKGQRMAAAKQLLENLGALFFFGRRRMVVLPSQLLCILLELWRDQQIQTGISFRVF